MGRRKIQRRLAKFFERQVSVPRRVLLVFIGLVVIFGAVSLASYILPGSSAIAGPVVAVIALPPALLLLVVGASLSAPLQLFVDVYFLFVAVPYWLLLAYAVSAAFERIKKSI